HQPDVPFLGECLFLHAAPPAATAGAGSFAAGWAAGATRSIARVVQPLRLVRLASPQPTAVEAEADAGEGADPGAGPSSGLPEVGSQAGASVPPAAAGSPVAGLAVTAPGSAAAAAAAASAAALELPLAGGVLGRLLTEAAGCYEDVAATRAQLAEAATTHGAARLPVVPRAGSAGGGGEGAGAGQPGVVGRRSTASSSSFVLIGPHRSSAGGGSVGSGGALLAGAAGTSGGGVPPGAPPPVTITALNRLCPMGQSLRTGGMAAAAAPGARGGGPSAPEQQQQQPPPAPRMTTSLPLWVVHDETGGTGGAIRALAERLTLPVYGINLPYADAPPHAPAAAAAAAAGAPSPAAGGPAPPHDPAPAPASLPATLAELGALYAGAILAAQPHGPYALAGTSVFGCMAAFAAARELEARGYDDVLLVLLDGPPCAPSTGLVNPAFCSLFQSLLQHALYDGGGG
ncbi:hypothetical protein TSOC_015045, partial [Tetrabaena socialis]